MSDIQIIDKPEAKSVTRKVSELTLTTAIWGLWLYLLLPVLNILLWIIGLSTMTTEILEKGGYLIFFELVQQMGLVILVTFTIMRLWGIYNYYRFGRRERRNHKTQDSIEKLSHFFQLTPAALVHLETRNEIIWPHQDDSENAGKWLQDKAAALTPEQLREDEGNIVMRFHDVSDDAIPSITKSALTSLIFVVALAALILFSVGGFQQKDTIPTAGTQVAPADVTPADVAPADVAPAEAVPAVE